MRRLVPAALAAGVLAAFGLTAAGEATSDIGHEGLSFSGTSTPTGTKRAESVLWWNDGYWWAVMWDTGSGDFHIYKLDVATQTWSDTGVPVDTRSNTHADVLWNGTHLYIASHEFVSDGSPAESGVPSYLFRFSYDAGTDTYSRDSGFPVAINNSRTETLVIDQDSTGKLWATWQQDNRIYVNRTLGDDTTWGTPFVLPVNGTSVTVDDNSSVVAFAGNKIGVMWSNQTSASVGMWFAVHVDGQPDSSWEASRTAVQGSGSADDHINLKSLQADGSGRVYAAVKTEHSSSEAPLIMLLVREPANGDWASHVFGRVSDCHNRPLVLIDEENRVLHMFATGPAPSGFSCNSSGGAIYEKTSPLDAIAFPLGAGTAVIQDADSPTVHNATSTKQNVTSATGIVVLAVNSSTRRYWHHYESLGPPPPPTPPTADFTGTPTTGSAPLAVSFNDASAGSPTSWSWSFGDGGQASERNPTHVYAAAGTYTVSLTVSNSSGTDTKTRVDYVTATPPPPDFALGASPSSRAVVRGTGTTYTVTVTPSNGFTGSVALTVAGLPDGATGQFAPNPLLSAGSSTLTVTTSTTTKQGSYALTIRGSSGSLQHSTSVALQVKRR